MKLFFILLSLLSYSVLATENGIAKYHNFFKNHDRLAKLFCQNRTLNINEILKKAFFLGEIENVTLENNVIDQSRNYNYPSYSIELNKREYEAYQIRQTFMSGEFQTLIITLTNRINEEGDGFDAKIVYNPDCSMNGTSLHEYSNGKRTHIATIRADKSIEMDIYMDLAPFSLEEIYKNNPPAVKTMENIKRISQRSDRVKVGIIDSGIDYNHPALAYKVDRFNKIVDGHKLGDLKKELTKIYLQIDQLQKEFEEQNFIYQYLAEDDYQLEMNKLKREFEKVSNSIRLSFKTDHAIGWDFIDDDSRPYDYLASMGHDFHGTCVASIIVNGTDDVALVPIREGVYHDQIEKNHMEIPMEFLHRRGVKIVNISQGSFIEKGEENPWKSLGNTIKNNPDVLFVIAAGNDIGNDNDEKPVYPASYPYNNIISVASLNKYHDGLAAHSNYGLKSVDVAAPGEQVEVLTPGNLSVDKKNGTSFAAPYVARVAAKIKFINPKCSPEEIIDIIASTVDFKPSLEPFIKYGGAVNEERALEMAKTYRCGN